MSGPDTDEAAAAFARPANQRSADEVLTLRRQYWMNDYRPVPIYNSQKRPMGDKWQTLAQTDPPAVVVNDPNPAALGTGIACGKFAPLDIDILDQSLVDRLVHFAEIMLGVTPLLRIGRAPKTLLGYRAVVPFRKMHTPEFTLPDGSRGKVEVLAQGQQVVADGIHPDTHKPYVWPNRSPADTPLADLPAITEDQARASSPKPSVSSAQPAACRRSWKGPKRPHVPRPVKATAGARASLSPSIPRPWPISTPGFLSYTRRPSIKPPHAPGVFTLAIAVSPISKKISPFTPRVSGISARRSR